MEMKRNSPFAMLRSPKNERYKYHNIYENEEFEVVQMPVNKKMEFLEREVKSDDTLQSIALEFSVSVADLKRANNIHKDNEIHARKIIKIPHKPYSLLLESKFFKEDDSIEVKAGPSKVKDPEEAVLLELVNNSNISESVPPTPVTISSPSDYCEETDVLIHARPDSPPNSALHCNGVDGDMSWGVLLVIVFCLCIGGPIFYLWLFWGRVEKQS